MYNVEPIGGPNARSMDIAKRQLLRDLGIDVWILRSSPETLSKESTHQGASVVAIAPPAEVRVEPTPQTVERSVREPVEKSASDTIIDVACVSAPGVLLLLDSPQPVQARRSGGRLVTDLLATTTGDWQITVRETQFRWPPAGIAKLQSQDGSRALSAFVEKQMQECGARWVLATDTVIDWLADGLLGDKLIGIPPIQDLGADGEQKRLLWRQIQTRLS